MMKKLPIATVDVGELSREPGNFGMHVFLHRDGKQLFKFFATFAGRIDNPYELLCELQELTQRLKRSLEEHGPYDPAEMRIYSYGEIEDDETPGEPPPPAQGNSLSPTRGEA